MHHKLRRDLSLHVEANINHAHRVFVVGIVTAQKLHQSEKQLSRRYVINILLQNTRELLGKHELVQGAVAVIEHSQTCALMT
jgi:ribosomal protein S3AE